MFTASSYTARCCFTAALLPLHIQLGSFCCFTAALLLLYCCVAAALLLFYCCFTASLVPLHIQLASRRCFSAALLLLLLVLYWCFTTCVPCGRTGITQLTLHIHSSLLLYCCFTAALLLLYCCFTADLLLIYCWFTADLLLIWFTTGVPCERSGIFQLPLRGAPLSHFPYASPSLPHCRRCMRPWATSSLRPHSLLPLRGPSRSHYLYASVSLPHCRGCMRPWATSVWGLEVLV